MRTLSTLATLLVGLAFVFLAPTAKADCPHGTKFIHPHCDGVEPPDLAPGPLVVRDDDGILIGTVIEVHGEDVRDDGSVNIAMQMEVAALEARI